MRIALITSSYPRNSGDIAGPFVRDLAEALIRRGHDVEVFAPRDPLLQDSRRGKVRVHWFRYAIGDSLHVLGYGRSLEGDRRLRRLAVAMMPAYLVAALSAVASRHLVRPFDLIQGHWLVPGGFLAALAGLLFDRPFGIVLHGSDTFVAARPAWRPFAKWALARCRYVAACSPDLLDQVAAIGAPRDKLHDVTTGVDVGVFSGSRRGQVALPASDEGFAKARRTQVVAAVGRMVEKKGFEVLLRAAPAIIEHNPDVRFVIGGSGPLFAPLRELARDLGIGKRTTFPGSIPWVAMPGFLAGSDVFVVPSIVDSAGNVDGLPAVMLEAMAAGRAIVGSDIAGIRRPLFDGRSGRLVPPGDPAALAAAVNALLADPAARDALGRQARTDAAGPLSWDTAAAQYEELYEKAIA